MRSVRYSTLPAFDSSTARADVHGHGPDLGVRHLAGGTEDPAEAADHRHQVGGRDRDVEVVEAILDPLREVLGADHVGTRLLGLARLVALREHRDLDVLAEPVGQRDRAAQLLVRVADVQPGAHVHLDGLVELHARELLDQRHRLGGRVLALAIEALLGVLICLSVMSHNPYTTSTPIERAVPAMIFAAASISPAFRSFIFFSAIWRS